MVYERFYQIVCELYSTLYPPTRYDKAPHRSWHHGDAETFIVEWRTGGASGGNCWGDDAHPDHDANPEPELDLTALFEKICPNMTYLQYRKVMGEVEKHSTRFEAEYYGNYNNYAIKSAAYRDLYDSLMKHNVIE